MTRDAQLSAARRRLRLIGGVFVVAFVALGLRLVDLTLMSVDAATDAQGVAGAPQSTRRADIVDRHGGLIATDYPKTSLFADPAEVLDPAATASQLASVLAGVDRGQLLGSLTAPRRFVWLKRHLPEEERRAVVRLGLPGIGFRTEWHRVYPQRELTSHLVGYVGVENQGLAGIEYSFQDRLSGPGAAAGPLALTIDLGVQEAVRSELAHAVERFRAAGGTGLVLDARSGEILAMVSLPDFDPNRYWQAPVHGALQSQHPGHLRAWLAVQAVRRGDGAGRRRGRHRRRLRRHPAVADRAPSDPRLPRQTPLAERARDSGILLEHRRGEDGP